jgi:hypothetical protein
MKNKTFKIKKKVINLYNFWHLGDNIFTMIYLYNCKDYIIKNNISINIYIRKNYVKQVQEFICCNNIKIHPIKFIETCKIDKIDNGILFNAIRDIILDNRILCKTNIPKGAINTYIGYDMLRDHFLLKLNLFKDSKDRESFNSYLCKFFTHIIGKKIDFPAINKFVYTDPDLLKRYNSLPSKYKDVDVLIINSIPRSNQFDLEKNKKEFNHMIHTLHKKNKIVTTEKIHDIPCTADDNLTIKDIGAISTHAKYIIAINTGPLIPCLNSYAFKNVKKWFEFDINMPFKYPHFKVNPTFDEIIKEIE